MKSEGFCTKLDDSVLITIHQARHPMPQALRDYSAGIVTPAPSRFVF
jgi:hypothetical protein